MAISALSDAEISEGLNTLNGWEREDNHITKTYKFTSYLAGIAFASAVGVVAEGLDHHPDLLIGWRKVTIRFSTHDAGNQISQRDLEAARAVDALGYPKA
ncbi:MAG: 4a-hydroxytetrahydrobiopterin dehydratase [Anaerolineae bacterium]|jgi:4a-hydroxytetrahydrobiopterin dehydratase|nr:4a-hydroxytetrahydrobiopterin dehydratase [Anaerolineae bacterium]